MNLLYLHQHFTTPKGASGTRSYELAVRMVAKGHKVTVLCGSFGSGDTGLDGPYQSGYREGLVDGIRVIELYLPYHNKHGFLRRSLTFLSYAFRTLISIHRIEKPDLIYASSTPLTVAIPALWAKFVLKVPYVFEVRDLWPELPREMKVITNPIILKGLDVLESLAYKHAKACIGLSPGMIAGIKSKQPNKTTAMIPNGCDLDKFSVASKTYQDRMLSKIEGKAPFSRTENQCHFVFAGTLGIANGLDAVILAVACLPEELKAKMCFHFIGDGNRKEYLVSLIEEHKLQSSFVFHEPMPKVELIQWLGWFDVAILTLKNLKAFYDGTSPNKFFDYLASGLPIVVNYPGWVADIISERSIGVVSPPEDPQLLASAFIEMSEQSQSRLYEMSLLAREVAQKFDRNVLSNQQIELCESVYKKCTSASLSS